jgi:hypothetical protein
VFWFVFIAFVVAMQSSVEFATFLRFPSTFSALASSRCELLDLNNTFYSRLVGLPNPHLKSAITRPFWTDRTLPTPNTRPPRIAAIKPLSQQSTYFFTDMSRMTISSSLPQTKPLPRVIHDVYSRCRPLNQSTSDHIGLITTENSIT